MTDKTYWRGYIDAQNKIDWMTKTPIATAKKEKTLKPLAKLLQEPILEFRSGYMVKLYRLDRDLPQPKKSDPDYVRGFFKAAGKSFKKKATVTSTNLELFITPANKLLRTELPKAQRPSKASDSLRVIITGPKFEALNAFLEDENTSIQN